MNALSALWDWVDNRLIVRRVVLGVTVWMSWYCTEWAQNFAQTSERSGTDIAMIIASVTALPTVLVGYVFKLYSEGRQ